MDWPTLHFEQPRRCLEGMELWLGSCSKAKFLSAEISRLEVPLLAEVRGRTPPCDRPLRASRGHSAVDSLKSPKGTEGTGGSPPMFLSMCEGLLIKCPTQPSHSFNMPS